MLILTVGLVQADTTEGSSQVFQPADSLLKVVPNHKTKAILPAEDTLLSPASDLRVTRKVGQDGLVIAWLPSPDPECTGYLVTTMKYYQENEQEI